MFLLPLFYQDGQMQEVRVRRKSNTLEARDSRLLGLAEHEPSQKMESSNFTERTLGIRQE